MKIPIAKPYLTAEEAQSAYDTILSGWLTQGTKVATFEQLFAKYVGSAYAVATSSGTTALHLAMIVAGLGIGDEVICPSLSYIATANAIRYTGAKVVFAEVNQSYNLDINDVKNKITEKTKAILLVHQMGMPADLEAFMDLCKTKNLTLIEDAACAVGSAYFEAKIGSHSDLVCFSFHPRKVITTGEGGMISTSNKAFYERLLLLRQHGMTINDRVRHLSEKVMITDHQELGYNYRMTDIQAAIGIKQLEKLDWIVSERRKIAQYYHESLKNLNCLVLPSEQRGYFSNYQSYSIYLKENSPISSQNLMQELLNVGIATRSGIMTSHRETAYQEYSQVTLPLSEDLSDNSVLLPLYVPMEEQEINFVVRHLRHWLCC